jgi:ATP-dependent DNA helicase RecG
LAITVEQINKWMQSAENESLEFKQAKFQYDTIKLHRYCVALSNEGGGKLILGVQNEPRKVVGSNAFPNLNHIKSKIFNKLRIRVDVEEVLHPDGRVIVFQVPPRPPGTPLDYEGSYYMRVGEELVPMTSDKLRQIFDEGKPDFFSIITKAGISSEDVIRLLDTQIYFDRLKMPYPAERNSVIERFVEERLLVKGKSEYHITNLGALLFAKDLGDFPSLKSRGARITVYDGNSKATILSDVFVYRGYAAGYEHLIDYIASRLPSSEIIGKAFREKTREMFPSIAIRELVANALVHQDFYAEGMLITIEIYADRIEIGNPGLSPIEMDRLLDSYQSRNEVLADLMRRLGICERKGSGIDKVISEIERWQLPAPDFRNGDKHFTALLFSQIPILEMTKKDKVRACFQHCVLKYVMNEKMSNNSLRERFDLPVTHKDVISVIIKNTVEEGLIKLDDPESTSKRYARYIPYWA